VLHPDYPQASYNRDCNNGLPRKLRGLKHLQCLKYSTMYHDDFMERVHSSIQTYVRRAIREQLVW